MPVKPKVSYFNCEIDKDRILEENKGKAVVYRLVNNLNGKTYVGSSVNLTVRLYKYYSLKHLMLNKTPIHNALIKYGHNKFSLEILEYCEEGENPVLREQYYLELLNPEYNVLESAGSSLGFKHKKETLEWFKNSRKVSEETRENLSLAASGRILTEETRKKISEARKDIKVSACTRAKMVEVAKILRGVKVIVKNIGTEEVLEFASLTDAAKAIGVSRTAVRKSIDIGRPIQNKYIVTLKSN